MLKVIIFDMDGVIIDTEPFFIKSENKLLKRYGYDILLIFLNNFSFKC